MKKPELLKFIEKQQKLFDQINKFNSLNDKLNHIHDFTKPQDQFKKKFSSLYDKYDLPSKLASKKTDKLLKHIHDFTIPQDQFKKNRLQFSYDKYDLTAFALTGLAPSNKVVFPTNHIHNFTKPQDQITKRLQFPHDKYNHTAFALTGLTVNKFWTTSASRLKTHQDLLLDIAKSDTLLKQSIHNKLKTGYGYYKRSDAIDSVIDQFSETLLEEIETEKSWSDLNDIKSVNNDLSEIFNNQNIETAYDVNILLEKLITYYNDNIKGFRKKIKFQHFMYLISVIGFALNIYNQYLREDPNKEKLNELSEKLEESIKHQENANEKSIEYQEIIDKKLDSLLYELKKEHTYQLYVAMTNVNVRKTKSKTSEAIGLVRQKQKVWVLKSWHKWYEVEYFDNRSREDRRGFVYKKHLVKVNG